MINNYMENDNKKTGPKPKELVEGTIIGLVIGRDKTVVPPEQVEQLAELGCSDRDIANFFGVKEDTLRYNFTDYLVKGRESMKIVLRRAMFKNATQNMNAAVQIFLAKNLLSMSDNGITNSDEALPWNEVEPQIKQEIEDETRKD